jgi:endo-1,4-beta-D-glucanase Y
MLVRCIKVICCSSVALFGMGCGTDAAPPPSPGSGGMTGSGGGGGGIKAPSDYAHNSPNAAFPYPQNKLLAGCSYPMYGTDALADAYLNWKAKFFQGGRVIRPENGNDTVSEGIAYGMLIGVYLNDRAMFDQLWSYAQSKFDGKGLMNWRIDAAGSVVGQGSAIDADEDMAWALLMAAKQWGGNYQGIAVSLIDKIWSNGVDGSNVLKPGDNFGGASQTNPSYFAPSYYRAFARVTSHNWNTVIETSYSIIAAASGMYGLVPNWVNSQGVALAGPGGDANGIHYGYDAARTPWRIAHDFCENGEPRAKAYLDKVNAFFGPKGPIAIKDGYTAAGGDPPGTLGDFFGGMVFYGPAGTAAMVGGQDTMLRQTYNSLATDAKSISGEYYKASWGVLSLMALTGNFWDMAR